MPLRNLTPIPWRPRGLSDSLDGSNVQPGSMKQLVNLVPAPSTPNLFIPRCASELQTSFPGFTTPGMISAITIIGTRAYGMVASGRFAGHDEPFIFDIAQGRFVTIAGVNANNVPRSPLTSGDWSPPTITAPTNSRIIFTHPGFSAAGPLTPYFGWLDVSAFKSVNALKGNTTTGSPIITSVNDGFTSAPILDGIQPGQTLTSVAGFSGPVTVLSCANGTFDLNTTGDADGTFTLTNMVNLGGVVPGMGVTGSLMAIGATVVSVDLVGGKVVMSLAALASGDGTDINFSGGGTITVSANATSSVSQTPLTVVGGTVDAPLWGAGNTNTNPLSHIPRAAGSYNGRAWFAVKNAVVFSDSLNPTQVTNSNQALLLGDHTDITAFGSLPFINTVTGGAQSALIAFKGPQPFFQITGDAATSNLEQNVVEGSVGTLAPNTICAIPEGLAFIAQDGLRILGLNGQVTQPIGAFGKGVSVPFIFAQYPSRMCAAYNQNTLRVSCQRGDVYGTPWQEFTFDFEQKEWAGPHTFPASVIAGYTADKVGFILAAQGVNGSLFFHSMVPVETSSYVENGAALNWTWETTLLPDNARLMMNRMLDTLLMLLQPAGAFVTVTFLDEGGNIVDQVPVTNTSTVNNPIWGNVTWGSFLWGAIPQFLKQYRVPWEFPLIFKQATVRIQASSQPVQAIGNLYMGYQILGYPLEDAMATTGYTALLAENGFTALEAMATTGLLATIAVG